MEVVSFGLLVVVGGVDSSNRAVELVECTHDETKALPKGPGRFAAWAGRHPVHVPPASAEAVMG